MSSDEFEEPSPVKLKKSKKTYNVGQDIEAEPKSLKKSKREASEVEQGSSSVFSGNLSIQHFLNSSNKINEMLSKTRNSLSASVASKTTVLEISKKESSDYRNVNVSSGIKTKPEGISESEASEYESTQQYDNRHKVSEEDSRSKKHNKVKTSNDSEDMLSNEDQVQHVKHKKSKKAKHELEMQSSKPDYGSNVNEGLVKHKKRKRSTSEHFDGEFDEPVPKKKHKKSRKEDFSSQDELEITSNTKRKSSAFNIQSLENFQTKNKNLTPVSYTNEAFSRLTENSSIFLLQLPKNLDPYALIGQSISLNKKTKLKVNKCKYRSSSLLQKSDSIVLYANEQSIRLQPKQIITMEPYSKSENIQTFSTSEKVFTATGLDRPQSLKQRNPTSGLDVDKRLSEHIKQKLQSAVKLYEKSKKEPIKKAKVEETSDLEGEEIFKYLSQAQDNVDFSFKAESKVKKKKHSKVKSEVSGDGFLSPGYSGFEAKVKEEVVEEEKPKKHKKKKTPNGHVEPQGSFLNESFYKSCSDSLDETNVKKSKKHKKAEAVKLEQETDAILHGLLGSSSHDEHKKHKKKKKNDLSSEEANMLLQSVKQEVETSDEAVKKKKKKKRANE